MLAAATRPPNPQMLEELECAGFPATRACRSGRLDAGLWASAGAADAAGTEGEAQCGFDAAELLDGKPLDVG
jgi:hypothetical protein